MSHKTEYRARVAERQRLGRLHTALCNAMVLPEAERDEQVRLIRQQYSAEDIGYMMGVIAQDVSWYAAHQKGKT